MPPKRKATGRAPQRARKPVAKKPPAKKPATRKPAAKKPAVKKPSTKKPAAKKAATKKPAAPSAAPERIRITNVPPPIDEVVDEVPPEEPWQFGGAPRAQSSQAGPDDAAREQAPPVSPFQPGFAPECMACPIGLVFFALKNTKPEVMEHLMKAGFEMFQAVRALMDQYNDRWEQAQTLQRIPIS